MPTILDRIVEAKHAEVHRARARAPLAACRRLAEAADPPRDFHAALAAPTPYGIHLIAEIKKSSPSAGVIRPDFDPVGLARAYAAGGATALSVLTDEPFFGGRLDHIAAVKRETHLPVLRKDFIVDEYQLFESRAAGADAVLLITEVLGVAAVCAFLPVVAGLGMAALVEVHTRSLAGELVAALPVSPASILIGINNRDLHSQTIDLAATERLAPLLRDRGILVAESGIQSRADVERMRRAGVGAVLIGAALLTDSDPVGRLVELLGANSTRV